LGGRGEGSFENMPEKNYGKKRKGVLWDVN